MQLVAVVRGQASRVTKSRARPQSRTPKTRAPRAAPAKFRGGEGIPPRLALMVAGGALVGALSIALFTGDRMHAAGDAVGRGMAGQFGAIGFRVASLKIAGASAMAGADIARAAGVTAGEPILAIDLEALRQRIAAVGWVQEVAVQRLLPGTIMVTIVERPPVAVWQADGAMRVIDREGRVIPEADPSRFPELPLLVGVGANDAGGGQMVALIKARPRLAERLEAMVRVDNRRWDLRLKDGGIIQLPATDEESALIQLDRMDQGQRLLELGFERIDMRSPEMVVVRRRTTPLPGQLLAGGV